jgi:hypothetical protein
MARTRLNTDEVFKSIMGNKPGFSESEKNEASADKEETKGAQPGQDAGNRRKTGEGTLVQTAFYITQKQRAALKIKAATSDDPRDKDQSAIVRSALDAYLADILN